MSRRGGEPGHPLVDGGAGLFQAGGQAHDLGHVLGAAPLAPLLGAAVQQVGDGDAPADVQGPHALGGVEFVPGQGQHVDVLLFYMDVHVAHRLHRVRCGNHTPCFLQMAPISGMGLDGADLVCWRT